MKPHYRVLSKADKDLDNQADYVSEHFGLDSSEQFIHAAHETFKLLVTHPQLGWALRFGLRSMKALRVFRVNGFAPMLILYRPLENGVEILRVVHGSRNLRALFRQPEEIE